MRCFDSFGGGNSSEGENAGTFEEKLVQRGNFAAKQSFIEWFNNMLTFLVAGDGFNEKQTRQFLEVSGVFRNT